MSPHSRVFVLLFAAGGVVCSGSPPSVPSGVPFEGGVAHRDSAVPDTCCAEIARKDMDSDGVVIIIPSDAAADVGRDAASLPRDAATDLAESDAVSPPTDGAFSAEPDAATDAATDVGRDAGRDVASPPRDAATDMVEPDAVSLPPNEVLWAGLVVADYGRAGFSSSFLGDQLAVVAAMVSWRTTHRVDEVLVAGDNFYGDPVMSACDVRFPWLFEEAFADLLIPFYIALGNHDGYEQSEPTPQPFLDYAAMSASGEWGCRAECLANWGEQGVAWDNCNSVPFTNRWNMLDSNGDDFPDQFYIIERNDLTIAVLNTNIQDGETDLIAEQESMATTALAGDSRWKLALAHHTNLRRDVRVRGSIRDNILCEGGVLPRVHLYIAAHIHQLRFSLGEWCGVPVLTSGGGGGELSTNGPSDSGVAFETHGFAWVEITWDEITVILVNQNGEEIYEHRIPYTPVDVIPPA